MKSGHLTLIEIMPSLPRAIEDSRMEVDRSRSRVEFVAKQMAASTVRGRFDDWTAVVHVDEGEPSKSFVRASIATSSLDTGHGERDSHLRDLFEVARHPTATFASTRVVPNGDWLDVTGNLSLHGATHEVTVRAHVTPHDDRLMFEGTTMISRKAFGLLWSAPIEWTSGVSDRVEIVLRLEAVRS